MRYKVESIPSGEGGTDRTVDVISSFVKESQKQPTVRLHALSILKSSRVGRGNTIAAARSLYRWVRSNVRFVKDPVDVETVQSPEVTLRLKAGDCDDHVGLLAALFESIGIPVRFSVIGNSRDDLQHIYVQAFVDGRWMSYDTTSDRPFGLPPAMSATKIYSIKGGGGMVTPVSTKPVVRPARLSDVKRAAYVATIKTLEANWKHGLINRSDLQEYLRVIDRHNSPSYGTVVEIPIRKAIEDFIRLVEGNRQASVKVVGHLSGLEGLDGFFRSVWDNVKSSVGTAVKYGEQVFGGGGTCPAAPPYSIQPTIQVRAEVPREVATAGVKAMLTSPTFIGLAALGLVLFLGGKKKRKRK